MNERSGTPVATLDANAAGLPLSGRIDFDERRYVASINGSPISASGSLATAAHRLASTLLSQLAARARRGADWGAEVHCHTRPGIALLYGNRTRGGGGGGAAPNACVAEALADYARGESNLQRALQNAASLLANCCRS